jgi:hypothetical protein
MLNYLRNIMVPLESPLDGQHDTHQPHQKSNQKEFWYLKKKKKQDMRDWCSSSHRNKMNWDKIYNFVHGHHETYQCPLIQQWWKSHDLCPCPRTRGKIPLQWPRSGQHHSQYSVDGHRMNHQVLVVRHHKDRGLDRDGLFSFLIDKSGQIFFLATSAVSILAIQI